jgi:phosphohistidine phosphatase
MSSKTLHIVRHGKSSWDFENISDIDRPLSTRGINNAYLMAKKLSERKVKPGLLISSPANRALYTALIFSRVMKLPYEKVRIEDLIYMGYTNDILELLGQQDNELSDILIFGHNPTFTSLANQLMTSNIDNIPTAGIVSLTFSADSWEDIRNMKASSDFFDYPRRYS